MNKITVTLMANILATLFFFFYLFKAEGGRFFACFGLVVFHCCILVGLLIRANWSRICLLVYSTFQIFALATASVVSLLSLQYKPFSTWTATVLGLLFILGPFLVWLILFLIGNEGKKVFKSQD